MRAMESRTIKKSKTSREKDKVATMTEPRCTVNGLSLYSDNDLKYFLFKNILNFFFIFKNYF